MMTLWFVVAVMATWRGAKMLSAERLPFALGVGIRRLFGVEHHADGRPLRDGMGEVALRPVSSWRPLAWVASEIGEGITCLWCCSVWCAAGVTGLLWWGDILVTGVAEALLLVPALSAGAILFESIRLRR